MALTLFSKLNFIATQLNLQTLRHLPAAGVHEAPVWDISELWIALRDYRPPCIQVPKSGHVNRRPHSALSCIGNIKLVGRASSHASPHAQHCWHPVLCNTIGAERLVIVLSKHVYVFVRHVLNESSRECVLHTRVVKPWFEDDDNSHLVAALMECTGGCNRIHKLLFALEAKLVNILAIACEHIGSSLVFHGGIHAFQPLSEMRGSVGV